jgi:site-specific recombinase XerD
MTMTIDQPKRKLPAEVYTPDEIARLVKACSTRAITGVRNRALIVALYRGGLRIGEALSLLPKDLDRAAGMVRVLHGKGDKARTVGLDDGAFAVIERWLDAREKLGIGARKPVFCTLKGEPIESAYIRALLPRLARKAGMTKRCHAHGFRHSAAFEMATEGIDLLTISAALGHASTATTDKYLRHIAPRAVIDTMRARVWEGAAL